MKKYKIFRELLLFAPLLIGVLWLVNAPTAAAADIFKLSGSSLCSYFPCPSGTTETEVAKSLAERIFSNIRALIGAIAIVVIIISGVKLISASGNEEVFTTETRNLTYAVLGLFAIGLSGEVAKIFSVDRGGFLADPNVALQKSRIFSRTVEIVITFIKYIVGSVAVLFIVRSGLRLVTLGGTEDEVGKDKKNIGYALLGLVIILMANPIINNVFFKIDTSQYPGIDAVRPGIDAAQLVKEIAGVTNIIAALAGPFALLSLMAGGLMYALGAGDDARIEKAKKIITWSLIGIVIIYGSFAIVSTFVARQFEGL
ncbi:hypothetical protein CO046_01110 [Candidatus Peregrinibacteria bacterium CG_4_9_14_0_2_um_filter_53_11]|nr:MAG: hypothetical protein CO046_01110 [Candidatus Peregrinibacteria bacterium CG_4_9_14_0_2_um_filter_53_11]